MTVIAYRDGVLAADRMLSTEAGLVTGEQTKIGRAGDARWATCGENAGALAVLEWLLAGKHGRQPAPESGTVIWIPDEGTGLIYSAGKAWPLAEAPFHAWGIGQQVALGAMHMGASAREACEAAIRWRTDCGGQIDELGL